MNDETFADFIRQLKDKNDIVDVIGANIKLERRGYNYWACCPFHHEKTPSFSINAGEKFYHCFGCGASGDVIGFIKEYEGLDFMQAVQVLAKRAGMEVPATNEKDAEKAAEKKKKHERLTALMRDAARFYLNNLYAGGAELHISYAKRRGLAPSVMKKFGIGASLDYTSLPAYLQGLGYTAEECSESGACNLTENGRLIDAEGERLIIPIINHLDEVIAFGGRLVKDVDRAKYKNTRETVLFNKSKNLYNINLVKREKRAGGLPSLIMVEGYMDAISLYQAGFKNVVASMGTSLTKEQARLCKRYTDNVLISYDGDFAGQKANARGLDILKQEGLKVRVVPMPEGLDPDDVIKQRGEEGYRQCLESAMPLIDFRIHAARLKYDLTRTEDRRDFVKEVLPIVKEAESEAEREELLKRISELSTISIGSLLRDLDNVPAMSRQQETPPVPFESRDADGEKKAARFVLAACLLSKPYAASCDVQALGLEGELGIIADYIVRGRREGCVRPSGLFDLMPDGGELSEVLNLDYGDNLDGARAERYFSDSLRMLERNALQRRLQRAQERYSASSDEEERRQIVLQIGEYTKLLNRYKTGGRV